MQLRSNWFVLVITGLQCSNALLNKHFSLVNQLVSQYVHVVTWLAIFIHGRHSPETHVNINMAVSVDGVRNVPDKPFQPCHMSFLPCSFGKPSPVTSILSKHHGSTILLEFTMMGHIYHHLVLYRPNILFESNYVCHQCSQFCLHNCSISCQHLNSVVLQ